MDKVFLIEINVLEDDDAHSDMDEEDYDFSEVFIRIVDFSDG
jgi:hypothetical protein